MATSRPSRPPYSPEFRARAVELARTSDLPPSQVASDLGVDTDTIRRWLRQAEIDAGRRDHRREGRTAPLAPRGGAPARGAGDLAAGDRLCRTRDRDAVTSYRFITDQAAH